MADYNFKVGDRVVTIYGETGEIDGICTCDQCKARGFCEPTWVDEYGTEHYITEYHFKTEFKDFYQIGEYHFNNPFNKVFVFHDIQDHERTLRRLREQYMTMTALEAEGLND